MSILYKAYKIQFGKKDVSTLFWYTTEGSFQNTCTDTVIEFNCVHDLIFVVSAHYTIINWHLWFTLCLLRSCCIRPLTCMFLYLTSLPKQAAPVSECHCCYCHICSTHRPSYLPLPSVSPGVQVLLSFILSLFPFPSLSLT